MDVKFLRGKPQLKAPKKTLNIRLPLTMVDVLHEVVQSDNDVKGLSDLIEQGLTFYLEHRFGTHQEEVLCQGHAVDEIVASGSHEPLPGEDLEPDALPEPTTSRERNALAKLKKAKAYARVLGGECLSTTYGQPHERNKKLTWRCAKGHEWSSRYEDVLGPRNRWCAKCATQARREARARAKVRAS